MPLQWKQGNNFGRIEDHIAPTLKTVYEEVSLENLKQEVRMTLNDSTWYEEWVQSIDSNSQYVLPKERYPKIDGSFDTGWNQRSQLYNSPSSHSFFVGHQTRKPVGGRVLSKLCSKCSAWKKKKNKPEGAVIPDHYCLKNFEGSSGAMEPKAAVDILTAMHDSFNVNVSLICMDDDASTRAALQWSNANYKKNFNTDILPQVPISKGKNKGKLQDQPDKGMLPGSIAQPKDVADPNHRRKILTGDLLACV